MSPQPAPRREKSPASAPIQVLAWLRRLAFGCLALILGLLLFDTFAPPVSTLMLARWLTGQKVARDPVPLNKISPYLAQAVIVSEDARFCLHSGVDWRALRVAAAEAEVGASTGGASTIDMQTVKNLFLFPGRFAIRKAVEIPMTLALDLVWSKPRILDAYLNVAEWGEGIFGAEAAARHYFHRSAASLTSREAALLAAALPNPHKRDPRRPRAAYARKAGKIMARMALAAGPSYCVNVGN